MLETKRLIHMIRKYSNNRKGDVWCQNEAAQNKIHLYRVYCNNKISNYAKANVDNTLMWKQNVKMH